MILTCGVIRRLRVHNVESRWDIVTLALTSKDDVALVVSATVRVDDLRIGSVDNRHRGGLESPISDLLSIGQRDLLDDRRLVQSSSCGRSTSILDKEDLIAGGMPVLQVRLQR